MKNIQLNLRDIDIIINGLNTTIHTFETKKKQSRSKHDKEWANRMIIQTTVTLNTMNELKEQIEYKIINDHRNYNYEIYPMSGIN